MVVAPSSDVLATVSGSLSGPAAHVWLTQMVTPTSGWALTPHGLWWTANTGRSWRAITPAGVPPSLIRGARFIGERGWVVGTRMGSGRNCRLVVYRTQDAGRTWSHSFASRPNGLYCDAARATAYLAFVSPKLGWVMAQQATSTAFNFGDLHRTTDGGRSWTQLPLPPSGGPISFATPTTGWIVGGPNSGILYHTTNAAATWTRQHLTPPPGVTATPAYSPPVFSSALDGVLAVTYLHRSHPRIAWYATGDGGATWRFATIAADGGSYGLGGTSPTTVAPGDRWIAMPTSSSLVVTHDATSHIIPTRGLPSGGFVSNLNFTTKTNGWAVVGLDKCLSFKSDCIQDSLLYQTKDGGRTWQRLLPQ
jgi:photosystem II stability/assembly factor-like uncharacterized protein